MVRQFNKEQKTAVTHYRGPAMVLAGPGSGKTLVITERVRWLIEEKKVPPGHILVITFAKAAAEEMKDRFLRFPGMGDKEVLFGTFHSVFFMMLRYAYRYNVGSIVRQEDKRRWIRDLAVSMDMEIEDENDFITNILNEISYVKGEMMSLSLFHSSLCSDEQFLGFYQGYENALRKRGMIDFDDMLVMCYDLLSERPDILAMWQDRFRFILIDEFQDINRTQYMIVKMLSGRNRNLFVVGDDDQSIYRFRGARPEIMKAFENDHPDTKKVILGVNYRCSDEIVDISARLISHNRNRYDKNLKSRKGTRVPVTFKLFDTVSQECDDIVKGISYYREKGIPYDQMAVIFRTNTQPGPLIKRLMENSIPFRVKDVIPSVFNHWIARDLIAYLKMSRGEKGRKYFLQVMNRPKRYISRAMITEPEVDFQRLKQMTYGKRWLYEKIDKMEMDLYLLKKMEPYTALNYIRHGIGYEGFLQEYADYRRLDPEGLMEVVDEIHESAKPFHTLDEWLTYIDRYNQILLEQRNQTYRKEEECVSLTTMHSAKGLEYEVVFIMDINEGITPHKKAVKEADLEEERRLFYVAVTRAKTYLFLYSVKEMYRKEVRISRYIKEISKEEEDHGS